MDTPAMPDAAAAEFAFQPLPHALAQRVAGGARLGDRAQIDVALEAA